MQVTITGVALSERRSRNVDRQRRGQSIALEFEATDDHAQAIACVITAVYDRYTYNTEKRAALDAWAERLDAVLVGRDSVRLLTFSRRA
ncbi:MAG: hypothetical protein AB7H96_11660 [Vicinamibacterales bacterium]